MANKKLRYCDDTVVDQQLHVCVVLMLCIILYLGENCQMDHVTRLS